MRVVFAVSLALLIVGCGRGQQPQNSDGYEQNSLGATLCSSAALDNGDGWGWENNQSCQWPGSIVASAASSAPECSPSAIVHGQEWGWENGQSCRWSSPAAALAARPQCSADALSAHGNWGWENGQSCIWGNAPVPTQPSVPASESAIQADDGGQCSPNALDTGDGWGWEYGAACQWGSVRPNSSAGAITVARPVSVPAPGFENGKPICLADASDGDNDGFGYENNRTCIVVEGVTATSDNPLLHTRWCEPWAEISYGDYVLQNNTWNESEVYADYWHQCIELAGNRSRYVAKWDYNWLDKSRGNEFAVKSYPQVYYGRKTRHSISGAPEDIGLPAPLHRLPRFKVRYKYSETGNPERNVALESFFHTSCEAEEWNKQFEMMVWVGVPVTRVPGPKVAEVTFDGVDWSVHVNPSLAWGYVAFVADQPTQEGWLDWNKFVNWTRNSGPAFGVPRLQGNTCMGAIEIGTETFWGQGTFTLHEFDVSR